MKRFLALQWWEKSLVAPVDSHEIVDGCRRHAQRNSSGCVSRQTKFGHDVRQPIESLLDGRPRSCSAAAMAGRYLFNIARTSASRLRLRVAVRA
jgi:hypothetical protein